MTILIPIQLAAISSGDTFKLTRDSEQELTFEDIVEGIGENKGKFKVKQNGLTGLRCSTLDVLWLDSSEIVFLVDDI